MTAESKTLTFKKEFIEELAQSLRAHQKGLPWSDKDQDCLEKLQVAVDQDGGGQERAFYTLSCGCKSHWGGIPAWWVVESRQGQEAHCFGHICERHYHELEATTNPPAT